MDDVVATGLVEVKRVLTNARKYNGFTLVAKLGHELEGLKAHLDSLMQLTHTCEIILKFQNMPLAIVGDFFETLDKCDQMLCGSTFEEAQLLKVVERFALHNAKLKLLLPPKPDVNPTSEDRELYKQYLEAQLGSRNTVIQPDRITLPSVQYVTKAFRGTILDDVTGDDTPGYYLRTVNAAVRHLDRLSSSVPDLSADCTSIAWVRLLTCLRLILRLDSWPALREDTEESRILRGKDISIQDFLMRLEFDLYRLLQTQQHRFPRTLPDLKASVSLIRAYSWGLPHQEDDQTLGDEYILRARLVEPANVASLGLKRISDLHMQLEFPNRSEYKINLQQVVLSPVYSSRSDSRHLRMTISNGSEDSHQGSLSLCFARVMDLKTMQNAFTGYERVYHGEQYNVDIMSFVRMRFRPKHTKTYTGSLQLWEPHDLSTRRDFQKTNMRTVQEIGLHRAQNQGTSRIRPQPSLLIFMGQDNQYRSFVFRIVLSLDLCRVESLHAQTREVYGFKIIPKSSRHDSFELDRSDKCRKEDELNLAIMGMFQQQRNKERKRVEVEYVEVRQDDSAELREVITTVQKLQLEYWSKVQEHEKLVAQDIRKANMEESTA